MTEYTPSERARTFRYPSTANLLIDSFDGTDDTQAYSVSIQKQAALMNGFFTRIATTEVVLDWGSPNIYDGLEMVWTILQGGTPTNFTIPGPPIQGFYTPGDLCSHVVRELNQLPILVSSGASAGAAAVFRVAVIDGIAIVNYK